VISPAVVFLQVAGAGALAGGLVGFGAGQLDSPLGGALTGAAVGVGIAFVAFGLIHGPIAALERHYLAWMRARRRDGAPQHPVVPEAPFTVPSESTSFQAGRVQVRVRRQEAP
jgi:hypothetical protein